VVYQQLTQLGHTDSAVGATKFTKVQIFPAALHAWQGDLLYVSDLYGPHGLRGIFGLEIEIFDDHLNEKIDLI